MCLHMLYLSCTNRFDSISFHGQSILLRLCTHSYSDTLVRLESEHAPPPDFQGKTRRKSVTFTPETKQQDGFGASALFKRLISEGEAQESRPAPDQSVNLVAATKESKDPIVQPGPPESGKKQRKARAPVPNGGSPKYVDYLRSFHTDKSSWKFNTKRQKQLLENLFNIDTIPPQDQAALLQYLSGLQGSAARRRVVESALAVLQQIAEKDEVYQAESTMESEEERRAAYQAALNRHLERYAQAGAQAHDYDEQQLDELRREAESGKRAEAVLREMLEKELYPDRVASTEPQTSQSSSLRASTDDTTSLPRSTNSTTTAMPGSKRKKRKARTQGIVEDSSEESSDSESSVKRTKPTSNGHSTSLATSSAPSARPFHQDLQQKSLGKKKIFDDDLLDQMFPKKSTDKWRK